MQKDPMSLTCTPAQWATLEPRETKSEALFALIDGKPQLMDAYCLHCNTRVSREWCTAKSTKRSAEEIRHLVDQDIGFIRPSELKLILKSLL
jgi:hypothetical protein